MHLCLLVALDNPQVEHYSGLSESIYSASRTVLYAEIQGRFTLNSSFPSLQTSVNERLKQLQDAHRDFGPGSQHFLSCT